MDLNSTVKVCQSIHESCTDCTEHGLGVVISDDSR